MAATAAAGWAGLGPVWSMGAGATAGRTARSFIPSTTDGRAACRPTAASSRAKRSGRWSRICAPNRFRRLFQRSLSVDDELLDIRVVHRLHQVHVEPRLAGLVAIGISTEAGERHEQHMFAPFLLSYGVRHLVPTHIG